MSMWDDEAGYDLSDPKHPSYADRMYDAADLARKRERERRGLADRPCMLCGRPSPAGSVCDRCCE